MVSVILKVNDDLRLLPIWLDYHKHIFHSGKVVVDHNSDREDVMRIVHRFFPTWEIALDGNPSPSLVIHRTLPSSPQESPEVFPIILYSNEFVLGPCPFDNVYRFHKMHCSLPFPNNIIDFLDNLSDNSDVDVNLPPVIHRRSSSHMESPAFFPIVFLCDGVNSHNIRQLIQKTRNDLARTDYVYYLDAYIHSDVKWGEDRVILFEDTNLLEYTNFNPDGHAIYKMNSYNNPSMVPISGYSSPPFLSYRESGVLPNTFLQNMVKSKIEETTSQQIDDISKYHLHISNEEHTKIINAMPWKKTESTEMKEFAEYMEYTVSEILERKVKIFNDDIWVRICRPSSVTETDYNPCHRDIYLDFYRNIVNIYVPIVGSNERSSLAMQSGSHYWNERDIMVTKGGTYFPNTGKKYSVDAVLRSRQPLEMVRPNPGEDEFILFSPYLIHGCSSNENPDTTRISVEIRFIEDTEAGRKQESNFREFLETRIWR